MKSDKKPNIMVIDDEKSICDLIKLFLEQTHLFGNIVVANNARVGLLKIENEEFNLVIFNCKISDKNSLDFVNTVSTSFKLRKIRIVITSGFLDSKTIDEFIKLGVRHILLKPFTRSKLIKTVCDALDMESPV